MKFKNTQAVSLLLAGAVALTLAGCGASSSGSVSSLAATSSTSDTATGVSSPFGSAESFDYTSFSYSQGIDENGFWAGVTATDYVTLPENYNALSIPSVEVTPTDDDIQAEIDSYLKEDATTREVKDRAAVYGDTANIDYAGRVNGATFTGSTDTGYNLTLGSNSFIDDFEGQIVGHTPGETFDVTVTFPEGYSDSTDENGNPIVLSGAEAVFTVTLNYISETVLPELTDEWVEGKFGTEFDVHTVDEMRTILREGMLESNKQSYILDYLWKGSRFETTPDALIDYQVCECLNYYSNYATMYGMSLDDFIQSYVGYDSADAMLTARADSIDQYCQEALLMQAVAEKLSLTVSAEDLEPYADKVESYGEPYLKMYILSGLALTELSKNATLV